MDLARDRPEVDAVAAVDAALLRELVTGEQLAEALARQATVPGIPRAVRAVALADGRAESWLETKGRLEWDAAGLRPFVPQVELWQDGEYVVVDGWDDQAALAVMMDGRLKYRDGAFGRTAQEEVWREKRAEDRLRAAGVRFVRLALPDFSPRPWRDHTARIRALQAVPGPAERTFRAAPRSTGRVRVPVTPDDGWLFRADDRWAALHGAAQPTSAPLGPRGDPDQGAAGRVDPGESTRGLSRTGAAAGTPRSAGCCSGGAPARPPAPARSPGPAAR